ncbi:MAG: hydrogenase iron-sulfur subunit [Proteobacteria bacterium]|nr:hydrogenase iron-sulfur subunit [Pseudomonadota bacterium]
MDNFKIILFLCNWGPHVAFQDLQDKRADIPAEIKMVRIPCIGRISKSLLFKPFEMGADGVLLIGCSPGSCRYGSGTDIALRNTEDTRQILELIGLNKQRLQLNTFLPDEPEELLQFLKNFCEEIKAIGPSPVTSDKEDFKTDHASLAEIISAHDIYACQDCGKCTSSCPLTLSGKPFSPRAIASSIIAGNIESESVREGVWSCLTCGLCYDRCPSAVNFPDFIKDLRIFLKHKDIKGHESHGGFFQSLMRTMTSPAVNTKRWENLPEDIRIDPKSTTLFFGGCAPYFDKFFKNSLGVNVLNINMDSIRLLNFFDIVPSVLPNERCCGHDLLWTGDIDNFKSLGKLNVDAINNLGIEQVITSCPECYRTLSYDYPKNGIDIPFKVTHMYDFLETEISKGAVDFKETGKKITFQDSCRLSRFADHADLPRKLLQRLKPDSFTEMHETGTAAICCGNTGWTGCDSHSKALQVKRLRQARATGSNLLITSCPKCQIHLKCAMQDPFCGDELSMEAMDLTNIIAKTIYWK